MGVDVMRYWSDNPELYDEITTEALPEPWKEKVVNGVIELSDVPDDVLFGAAMEGEKEYWAGLVDDAMMRIKNGAIK